MGQKNRTLSHTPGVFGPRAGRVWSGVAVVAGFSVALLVALRAGVARRDQWILGDWLIDYSVGFTRRGLVGEAIRQLEGVFGIDRIIATTVLQVSVLLALMALVLVLVSSSKRGLTTVLLFASPAFVLFLLNPLGTLRKEILLWLLIAGLLVWSRSGNASAKAIPWLGAIVFPLLVLAHEALVFFAGFVAIMFWLLVSEGTVSKARAVWAGGVGAVLTAIAGLASLFWPTTPGVGAAICARLVNAGYDEALCSGAIGFLDQDLAFSVSRVGDALQTGNYLGVYLPVMVLSLVPFLFVRWSAPMRVALVVSVAMTLPLFAVAIDWGRWIVISVWLVTLLVLRFDGSPHITVMHIQTPVSLWRKVAVFVGVAAFATLWSVPHCCEPRIGLGVIDRFYDALMLFGL